MEKQKPATLPTYYGDAAPEQDDDARADDKPVNDDIKVYRDGSAANECWNNQDY